MFSHDIASPDFITMLLAFVMVALAAVAGGAWLWGATHRKIEID